MLLKLSQKINRIKHSNCFYGSIIGISWRRKWQPTPVFLPGKTHGQRSLVGCSPWGRTESDTTEWLHFHFSLSCIGEGNSNPLQCSCLENPRYRGGWWAAVYGVAQSRTRLKRLSSSSSSRNIHRTPPPGAFPADHLLFLLLLLFTRSAQSSPVAQSCPTLCDPMNRSPPGLPVHHHLPEFTQTHIHRVGDAIQPSHPLSSPFPPAPNCSQHQRLFFAWGGQSTGVSALASFLPKKSQGWSPSEWTGWVS